jgi:ATP-dependent Clp protease protease subunit
MKEHQKIGNDFRNYAIKHMGIGGVHVDKYINQNIQSLSMLPSINMSLDITSGGKVHDISGMTRSIIEERAVNFREIDVFSRLIADRIIFLGTGVDDHISNILVAQMLFLQSTDKNRDIQMYINSPGGSVYAGLGIYDTMNFISPDVSTICTGLAASMGAVLLAGGAANKRFALPHSRIMIHQPLGGAQGQATDIEITAQQILILKKELYEILAFHSGKTYDEVYKNCERDYWMRSQEAKEYGLIDDVVTKDTGDKPTWEGGKTVR